MSDTAEDASRLRDLLVRYSASPADPMIAAVARELATRHTLDQLEAMAKGNSLVVRALFDRLLGRSGL
jgi:hypothetical protein